MYSMVIVVYNDSDKGKMTVVKNVGNVSYYDTIVARLFHDATETWDSIKSIK